MEPLSCDLDLLKDWVNSAKPMYRFVYHTGYGATDTALSSVISAYIYKQAVRGTVYLVRRRNSEDKRLFDYMAVKASPTPIFRLLPLPQDHMEVTYRMMQTGAKNVQVRKYRSSSLQS